MSVHKAGSYVEVPEEQAGARKSVYILLQAQPGPVVMWARSGHTLVRGGLGFKHDDADALNAKRGFAAELYNLSLTLDEAIGRRPPTLPDPADPAYERALVAALTLTKGQSLLSLQKLRTYGLGLRRKLDEGMAATLKDFGFQQDDPSSEPALTFANDKQAPILWDMMYEEEKEPGPPRWRNFWGFRVPVTHWESISRPDKIRLKQGLFSAIDQTLDFASGEVALLVKQFKKDLPHRSLSDEVRERVRQKLCELMNNDDEQINAWLAAQPPDSWLRCFLQKLIENTDEAAMAEYETGEWKAQTIRAIFTDPHFNYDLVHFACHCEPDKISELLTQLRINIAGADISLDVAALAEKREWGQEEPGPLVFLNACATGQQGGTNEPPGFPENWINRRGALAVVATLCPVPDLFAHAFALKFYRTLFGAVTDARAPARHRYLGEALLETRRYFMEECHNPLGLAYVLYAMQDARIEAQF